MTDYEVFIDEPLPFERPEVNVPLLRKAVEWVEAQDALGQDRSEWLQSNWFSRFDVTGLQTISNDYCGTKACVAGYISEIEGWKPFFRVGEHATSIVFKDSLEGSAYDVAREALGLTLGEADRLFDGSNSAHRVRVVAEEIAGERL